MATVTDDWRPQPSRIRHGWRCTRKGGTRPSTRRAPSGEIVAVTRCDECQGDDLSERLLGRLAADPDTDPAGTGAPPDTAA